MQSAEPLAHRSRRCCITRRQQDRQQTHNLQYVVSRMDELPRAWARFFMEYSRALSEADLELFWEEQVRLGDPA